VATRLSIENRRRGGFVGFLLRSLLALGVVAAIAGGQAAVALYVHLSRDLPQIPPFEAIRFGGVSTVRAAHGQTLAEVFEERRYLVPRDRIPKVLVDAVLASEDARFFEHSGLDLRGIARAVWSNLRAGEVREGASTLTQQLARTLLLGQEKSLRRKVREAILARRIEDIYSKDQILTLYLNLVFMGEGAYGIQAASRTYFGKDVSDLDASEAAIVATLPQSPGRVTPVSNPAEVRVRRDRVLRRMRETGTLPPEQEAEARAAEVRVAGSHDDLGDRAPVPASAAMREVRPLIAVDQGSDLFGAPAGLEAVTTIDLGLQWAAQDAVSEAARAIDRRQGYRGPLGRIREAKFPEFARRNRAWLDKHGVREDLPYGRPVLAVVTESGPDLARLLVAAGTEGVLPLANMAWAVPYTEFPKDASGGRTEVAKVSLDGKIDAVDKVLRPGDVVLVSRVKPAPPKAPPKRKKGKKAAPAPEPVAPPDAGPPLALFALQQLPRPQAALVAMEPRSGRVVAMAGGTDFDTSQVNRTESVRQTGSVVKPVYYSKAYDAGVAPSTVMSGAPFREGQWTPEGDAAVDDMTLWQALTRSENNVSIRVLRMVIERAGLDGLNEWARRLGLTRPFQGFAAEALGVDATPAEVLSAFGTFANGGIRPDPVLVSMVRDGRGNVLVDRRSPRDANCPILDAIVREVAAPPEAARRAITAEAAWITAANLRDVAEEGTAKSAKKLGRPVCGKTGTLPFDVWFAGWTHEVAAVAWVGQDTRERWLGRSRASGGVFGADTALPAWVSFARAAAGGRPAVDDLASPPEGVVVARVDAATGLLAAGEDGIAVPHLKGTEPTEVAPEPGWMPAAMEVAEF